MNYFTFIKNGISYDSRNYPDLIVSELPPITTPPKRHEIIYIDGVDGGMVQEKGYGTYEKTMLISLRRAIDIDDITFLLSGSGEIEFSNELGKLYRVTILNQIDYIRLGRFRTASVVFLAQPHKILKDEKPAYIHSIWGDVPVKNVGNIVSRPLITAQGIGSLDLTLMRGVEEIAVMHINLPYEEEQTAVVDCEKQNLYINGKVKNRHFDGDFFELNPGEDYALRIYGALYKINLYPRSRFI